MTTVIEDIERIIAERDKLSGAVFNSLTYGNDSDGLLREYDRSRMETAELVYKLAVDSLVDEGHFQHNRADEFPRLMRYYRTQMLINAAIRMGSNPHATGEDFERLYELMGVELERLEAE